MYSVPTELYPVAVMCGFVVYIYTMHYETKKVSACGNYRFNAFTRKVIWQLYSNLMGFACEGDSFSENGTQGSLTLDCEHSLDIMLCRGPCSNFLCAGLVDTD